MHSPLNMLVPSFHSLIDLSISSETPRKYIIWAIGQAWFLWMKKGLPYGNGWIGISSNTTPSKKGIPLHFQMGNQISSDMKQLLNLCTEQKPIKPADIRKQLVHEILRSILNGREGRGADHSDSQVALATAGRRNMMTCGAAAALAPRSAMARELPSPWSGRC